MENLKTVSYSPSAKSSLKMSRNRSRENELRNLGILEATDLANWNRLLFPLWSLARLKAAESPTKPAGRCGWASWREPRAQISCRYSVQKVGFR